MSKFDNVDNGKEFDFGKTSKYYAKYRDIYPKELYEKLYKLGVGLKGQDWLDLGTGTGEIPRGLYHCGANIVGVDISENQIAEAIVLAKEKGMNITYKACPAENTGFADNSFDVITACQCFWYFDKDLVVPEIKRILRPNGLFVKVYMAWVNSDPVAGKSQALVKRMNPDWSSGFPAEKDLTMHYFDNPISDSFYADIPFTKETWDGRIRACRGVLGSMTDEVLEKFTEEHHKLIDELDEEFTVRHEIFITAYKISK